VKAPTRVTEISSGHVAITYAKEIAIQCAGVHGERYRVNDTTGTTPLHVAFCCTATINGEHEIHPTFPSTADQTTTEVKPNMIRTIQSSTHFDAVKRQQVQIIPVQGVESRSATTIQAQCDKTYRGLFLSKLETICPRQKSIFKGMKWERVSIGVVIVALQVPE
jgi:hypothetical protein